VSDSSLFSASYAEARMRFLTACAAAGAREMRTYRHPLRGPRGEALGTDVAWFGPQAAPAVLVTLSATHGIEGFTGSALQLDWVMRKARLPLPDGIAALHIHALNPHGFAWLRRVTEEGIDLNRNFVDFAKPLPQNAGYGELHRALLAGDEAALDAYRAAHGERALEIAVSGGQYSHPDGMFYGGRAPSWSRRTVEAVIAEFDLRRRTMVAVVDIHTGLGEFGAGEVICDHPTGSAELARAKAWYGTVTEPALGTSSSVPKTGLIDYGWMAALGPAVTFVTLEFGTYSVAAMFRELRADQLLHQTGSPDWSDDDTRAVKERLKQHFCPDDARWREAILARGRAVLDQAENGLTPSS
jgi:hypothetical protein